MTIQRTGNGAAGSWNGPGRWSGETIPYSYDSVTIRIAGGPAMVARPGKSGTRAGSLSVGNIGSGDAIRLDPAGAIMPAGGRPGAASVRAVAIDASATLVSATRASATLSGIGTLVSQPVWRSGANSRDAFDRLGSISTPVTGFTAGDRTFIGRRDMAGAAASRGSDSRAIFALYQNPCHASVVFTHVPFGCGVAAIRIACTGHSSQADIPGAWFLAGTMVATDHGEVAIEQLADGDRVVSLDGSARALASLRRLARRDIDLTDLDDAAAREAAPIRISAHAFAANVPMRDLLIAPGHCILVDGRLIPAQMLVNGASIVQDRVLRRFTVYHPECEPQAILISNGLATGALDQSSACSTVSAADTRHTPHASVEPIRRRLLSRAAQLGLVAPPAARSVGTREPSLRLRLDDGTVLRARRRAGGQHFFVLPAGTERAILLSRSRAPGKLGGASDDRPCPGVLVHSATLWLELRNTAIPLAASWVQGSHSAQQPGRSEPVEGEAEITFEALSRTTVLEVTLAGAAP